MKPEPHDLIMPIFRKLNMPCPNDLLNLIDME